MEKGIIFSSLVKTMCVLCFSVLVITMELIVGDYRKCWDTLMASYDRNASHEVHNVTTRREFGIMTMLTFRLI